MTQRFVESTDGVRLAVYEQGNPDGPTLVMVHGWPNSHVMWDGVAPFLRDRFRIVTFDNRGAGASTVPKPVRAYTMPKFADDFAAVIAAVSPDAPVHVLAHDWGSVAQWEYLSRPEAQDRVASFTSVSGPSADHYAMAVGRGFVRPFRPSKLVRSVKMGARLSYWFPFSVPVVAPALMRAGLARRMQHRLTKGTPREQLHYGDIGVDAANSLKIYRAQVLRVAKTARRDHYVTVPVQLIVNTLDPVIVPNGLNGVSHWVSRLWRRDLEAGHWSPLSHPQVMAQAVNELVDHLEGKPASRALLRAEVGRSRKPFGDTLVSVTGAGSGIGRATALAFAAEGAEVVVSDINEVSAKETAAQIITRGGVAHAYGLDVSDAAAVEAFADEICSVHGVPDVVVNNAGIGQAGLFLDTPAEQWDRVLDINLGGVVNGCRAFAGRLVQRGTGGHIVNVASMAAYSPLGAMNAYCTSKAAVYMFSDCLRAELAGAGIGLTTICPGVVDTNIVSTTRFDAPAGKEGDVDAFRARTEKMYTKRSYGPEKVAKAILESVEKNTAVRPVTPEAYAAYGAARVLPQVLRRTARRRLL